MRSLPRVGVIGAGACGIAAVKALSEHGYEVDGYEKSDAVGGNWGSTRATWSATGSPSPIIASAMLIPPSHQSQWICDHLAGRYALPAPIAMRADIEADRRRMFKRYVASTRHTMQVDYDDCLVALGKERRAGAERARRIAHTVPIAARTSAQVAS